MNWPRRSRITLTNARVQTVAGLASSISFTNRVVALDDAPRQGDAIVDLDGAFVLPGLINGHDHLELNHYGTIKYRDRYDNASEWIEDVTRRLHSEPRIRRGRAVPLADRLFLGGLKNLLAGATTVAHHNPLYRELRTGFPIRVVRRYGWAHSFLLEDRPVGARGEKGGRIFSRFRSTAPHHPFVVHVAEGTDASARAELSRLERLGCLGRNTVLVHGVGLDVTDWVSVFQAGAGLIWCPASNEFLFGRTAAVDTFLRATPESGERIALGTDSRLTGARDLLDELRVAFGVTGLAPERLLRMVTTSAAALLRTSDLGRIQAGAPADLMVIPPTSTDPAAALLGASRADLGLVVCRGRPLLASPNLTAVFTAERTPPSTVRVDGAPKLLHHEIAERLRRSVLKEPGLDPAAR